MAFQSSVAQLLPLPPASSSTISSLCLALACLSVLKHDKCSLASGPPHMLFTVSGTLFPSCVASCSIHLSHLSLDASLPGRPSQSPASQSSLHFSTLTSPHPTQKRLCLLTVSFTRLIRTLCSLWYPPPPTPHHST